MKIEVRNLGVITEAQIDLKPLTIFVGPNNAGKTWLAYTLAGILGDYGWMKYTRAYTLENIPKMYPPLDNAIQTVLDEGSSNFDLVQFADEFGEKYINSVAALAQQWMQEFMGSEHASFEDLEIQVKLLETKTDFLQDILKSSMKEAFPVGQTRHRPLLNALKEENKSNLYFYTEKGVLDKLPPRVVKEFFIWHAFQALHRVIYPDVYTFPTERTTFITFPFTKMKREAIEINEQEPNIKSTYWPVAHFLSMIFDALQTSWIEREKEAKKDANINSYVELAQLLEASVLNGEVDFTTPEPELQRELLFRPKTDTALEMSIVSSMVKELSPLVLYLRYIAERGDWLIIDEPEMNLHPEAQARFTEFLAMLVQADLQILLTTHSPYVVDHLANLMKAAESTEPDAIKEKFYLQRKEAFISKDKVSVYLVDKGKTENILDEEGVIHWDTFSRVSDRVTEIYFEI